MDKFGVKLNLAAVAEARREWARAKAEFDANVEYVMRRLLHEAAANYMSVETIAAESRLSTKKVRKMMRDAGIDPRVSGKRLLSDRASKALHENAELMGVEPHEVDLTSPLAYLPMGKKLRGMLNETATSQVAEPDDEWDESGERLQQDLVDILKRTFLGVTCDDSSLAEIAGILLEAGWHK